MKPVIIILGPTSAGKTTLSINLAKKYRGEILSADSRQIVKYMDIGTGKVPVDNKPNIIKNNLYWNIDGVNIWGYDLIEPDQYFSGYDYCLFALDKIKELNKSGKRIIITGGTGFYLDLLTGRVHPDPVSPDLELRKQLEAWDIEKLRETLNRLNPLIFGKIDKNNKVRLIRAVEKESAGSKNSGIRPLYYPVDISYTYVGLKASNELLFSRADSWADKIWNAGLVSETEHLINMGYGSSPRLKSLIYKTCVLFIEGNLTEAQALTRIKYDLHAYIRRQLTWFKRNPEITWFDVSDPACKEKVEEFVDCIYNKHNG